MGIAAKKLKSHWPIVAIVFVWLIFSSPYFLKGLIPFPSKYLVTFFPPWSAAYAMPVKNNAMPDVITQIYPWKKLTIDMWKSGQIPLWNPYSFSGTSHAANYQSAVFSPFNLLFFIFPFVDAWSILVLLQPLIAGIFMYVFLRNLDRSREASFVGSIAFMFCGFMVVWMAYATLGFAALWLPLILFAIHRQFKKNSWWNLALLSLAIPLSLFSGHFQISIYVVVISIVFLLFETLLHKEKNKSFFLFLFFGLGVLIALPQILPAYNAYISSFRSVAFSKGEIIPFQYLITIFAPDFFGNPVTRNDWFGHYAEWSSYIGIIPLMLVIYSLFGKKNKYIWFFSATAIAGLFLATPTLFNDLLFNLKVPVLSTSSASRIIVLVSFSLAVLSSFGLDALIIDWEHKSSKKILLFCSGIGLLLTFFWIVFLIRKPLEAEKFIVAKRNLFLPSVFVIFGLVGFIVGAIKIKVVRFIALIFLLFFISFDLLRFAMKWMPFDPRTYVYPAMPITEALHKYVGMNRVVGNFGGELSMMYKVPSLEGYDAVYQERYGEFMRAVSSGSIDVPERSIVRLDKHGKYAEDALALLGVKFVLHRLSDGRVGWTYPIWQYFNYHPIYRDDSYEIYENNNAFPRAFFASEYEVILGKQKIIDRLFSQGFDRKKSVILETEPNLKPQEGAGSVEITKYSPTEIDFVVNTPVNKLLFLSDVYDPGWKAFVDNRPAPVYRADFDFRSIPVAAGAHAVRMIYKPVNFIIGTYISIIILIFLALGSARAMYYAHRHI